MNKTVRVTLAALFCVGAVAACSKKAVKAAPPPPPEPMAQTQAPTTDGAYTPESLDTVDCLRQRTVYFDFDSNEVKPEYQAFLACHAKYLRDRPSAQIRLTGNTDERGTREYNLGLGERRGNAVQGVLAGQSGQVTVVSKGKEDPTCREHNEDCWSKNRRVEIEYTAK
jgi:peptidoglycan-associated lipoprotein